MSRKRSGYRPRPVLKPLGMKNEVILEMPARISQLSLGTDWMSMSHLRDIGAHALLVETVSVTVGDAAMTACAREMIGICIGAEDRFDRTGKAGVTGEQMTLLRRLLELSLPWLSRQPNPVIYNASEQLVRRHDRLRDAAKERSA